MRVQWNQYLKSARDVVCPRETCVYNEHGYCDEPYINYGNGDAECHDMSYKEIVEMLGIPPQRPVPQHEREMNDKEPTFVVIGKCKCEDEPPLSDEFMEQVSEQRDYLRRREHQ